MLSLVGYFKAVICKKKITTKHHVFSVIFSLEFLQPYKPRPETVASVARNLVAGALGLQSNVPREVRAEERRRLKEAKGQCMFRDQRLCYK